MKITKAVIPAAGLGTRVLPSSKSVPKEMLNIVDKPAIQYIVEEAAASGITDILIINNRGKEVLENHFDRSPELEQSLEKSGKLDMLEAVKNVASLANVYFLRQKETKGLGHAVLCAKAFIGNEPFAVLYGDDVIISQKPVTKQLIDVYEKYHEGVVGVKEIEKERISHYCSLKVENQQDNIFDCTDIIEKPRAEQIMSNYAIMGRCILPPEIFKVLENTSAGVDGEIQLTDALAALAKENGIKAVEFEGSRFDLGNKLGILKANVEVGIQHSEIGEKFKEYLKEIARGL